MPQCRRRTRCGGATTITGDDLPTPVDFIGRDLTCGDVDRDGKDDLAVGAPNEQRAGRVTLLFGARRGLGSTARDQTVGQSSTGVPGRNERGDGFGAGVSLLDVTGDEFLDLSADAPGEDSMLGGIVIVPSRDSRLATRRSLRVEADDLPLHPERGEIALGSVLGR